MTHAWTDEQLAARDAGRRMIERIADNIFGQQRAEGAPMTDFTPEDWENLDESQIIRLPQAQFDAFVRQLEQPPKPMPRLAESLRKAKGIFDYAESTAILDDQDVTLVRRGDDVAALYIGNDLVDRGDAEAVVDRLLHRFGVHMTWADPVTDKKAPGYEGVAAHLSDIAPDF